MKLSDVCTKGTSNIAQKDLDARNGCYPIYGASGFIKNVDFYHQEKPYIALVKDGAGVGRVMQLPAKSSVIGTMQYIMPNEGVSVEYLAYALEHMNLSKYYLGAAIPHIYFKDYCSETLPNHTPEEQAHISHVLGLVSNLIFLRKQQLAKLDELVKSRFIEMFVTANNVSDWMQITIADVSTDMRTGPFGSALHHDEFVDSGVFVLGIDNAVENKFSYNRMRYITEEKYRQLKRYTVYPGDVIITIMGTVGRSAVIPQDMPKSINTKHLACITPNTAMIDSTFLSSAFQMHPAIRLQLQNQCKGAIMDGLNLTIIKGLRFALPPIDSQQEFAAFVEQIDKSKFEIQNSLEKLEMLKKALMQKYFG